MEISNDLLFWLTNFYALIQIIAMAAILLMLVSVIKPCAKKHGIVIRPHLLYAAILLYSIHRLVGFLIFFLGLTDKAYEIWAFTNILFLISAILVYIEVNHMLTCEKVDFNAT